MVFASLHLKDGLSGQLAVNWSDETYRKMSTSITIWGEKGKIICDATELKIYLKQESQGEEIDKGWTIKYVTDLTKGVNYYLRGEEYSYQMDYFFNQILETKYNNISNFANALMTDETIQFLLKDSIKN